MIKNCILVLLISVLLPIGLMADWVSINKSNTSNTEPSVKILNDDNSGTTIKIDLSGFDISEFITEGKSYNNVDLLTGILTAEPGYPELPYIAKVLAIPDLAGVSVEVIETGEIQTFADVYLPPARVSWIEGDAETPYEENSKIYQSDEIYPKEYVKVEPPSIFRDFRIARVSVFPIHYVPANKELQVVSFITIRLNYGKGEVINPKTSSKKQIAPSFGKLYRNFIFNYQSVLDNYYDGKEEGHELMLCIMDDMFYDSFQIYADWNRQSGTDVHITKFSDIGANSSNPNIIKDHISDAYYNWETPPTYVLIVGDEDVFPIKIVSYDYSFPNEDYFVEIEGDDYFPEMMIGRFTNQGDYRMQVMINKFMLYEKTPYTEDDDWFKKGICCSNNEYPSQVETKRYTAGLMLEDGGFTSVDTLMSDGYWGNDCSMDKYDVINALNDGRSYLNYRGEGWNDGWWANCYNFNTGDVTNLNNSEKFTFVTSIGCGVAMFTSNEGNCFGEAWVQLGTLSEPRGGVAFVGPTSNTHTTFNNKIDKGIYVGMFQEGMDTPGQALLRGKLYMYNVYGNDYWVEYHYRVYCILGDPSLHIWKDIPLEVNVDHPSSILVGNNILECTVEFASTNQPVANAEFCITGEEIFVTGVSDSLGKVYIEITPEMEEDLILTVRGGNVYPYQGDIEVIQPTEHVELFGDPTIDDLDGNTDGLMNPNENCNIAFTLKNWGELTANDIQATISTTNSEYVEILSTDPVDFGNLAPGSSSTGDPFQIFVKPECPVGQIITIQVHITSSTSTWDYDYNTDVKGCKLMTNNYIVIDEDSPDMNFRMDPGETVKLVFSIENFGEDLAPDVMGILSTDDQYITVEDTIGSFGTIGINSVEINGEDFFMVSVDASCPAGYWVEYSLKLYTQDGNYPYETIPSVDIPISLPIASDFSGPDSYGYYAYSSDDAFYEKTPVYNWFELDGIGTQISIPNISDYTETVDLPFTFQYYGVDYDELRISTDGWIAFGSGTQTAPLNTGLPNNDNVSSMAAVYWDDLIDDELMEGEILYYHDNANNRFIVEWDSISHNNTIGEPHREIFQAILLDPDHYSTTTGDGEIIFQYRNIEEIDSVTIGIENHTQDIGIQYVYDSEYIPTASNVVNEYAIKYTTEPPFVILITGDNDLDLESDPISSGLTLDQNQPNPFSSNTWINYSIPEQSKVILNIYNIRGEVVRKLHSGQQSAGRYSLEWNGLNDNGSPVNTGIYFCRLQSEESVATMKMYLLR